MPAAAYLGIDSQILPIGHPQILLSCPDVAKRDERLAALGAHCAAYSRCQMPKPCAAILDGVEIEERKMAIAVERLAYIDLKALLRECLVNAQQERRHADFIGLRRCAQHRTR